MIKKRRLNNFLFFSALFLLIVLFFNKAFAINFFLDDFFFLRIGRANNLIEFIRFFSPFKTYFYRPLTTEIFYFFINDSGKNLLIAHMFVFLIYFCGLIFLYLLLLKISKNRFFSYLAVFLYGISFIHVFQLYQLATFIEVLLFTLLVAACYFHINTNFFLSTICFIGALLSKETAIFFPIILLLLYFFRIEHFSKKNTFHLRLCLLIAAGFYFLYRPSLSYLTTTEPFYRLNWNLKLITNNLMWYAFWSLGFPNFLPNYLTSIFSKPLPEFWKLWKILDYRIFFYLLATYYVVFFITTIFLIKKRLLTKKILSLYSFFLIAFLLFIGPTLPTVHRWMVRLTLPLIFIIIMQAIIIYGAYRKKGVCRYFSFLLIGLFILIQIFGIRIHEDTSVYLLESKISTNVFTYFKIHRNEIFNKDNIYFRDQKKNIGPWEGSRKLRDTLHGKDFIEALFPNGNKQVYFGYKDKKIPSGAYVINAQDILSGKK